MKTLFAIICLTTACFAADGPRLYCERKTNGTFRVWWQPMPGTNTAEYSLDGKAWTNASNWGMITTNGVNWCYTSTGFWASNVSYRVRIDPTNLNDGQPERKQ